MKWLDTVYTYSIVWIITIYTKTAPVSSQRRADIDIPDLPTYPLVMRTYTSPPPPTKPKSTTPNEIKIVTITSPPDEATDGKRTTLTSKNRKEVTSTYDETQQVDAKISDQEKSVDNTEAAAININYVIAGTAAGVVALIGVIATTLGVLASKGFFTPKGFAPVETAV